MEALLPALMQAVILVVILVVILTAGHRTRLPEVARTKTWPRTETLLGDRP